MAVQPELSDLIGNPDCWFSLRKHAHAIYSDFKVVKNENFQWIFFYIFLIFAQNIDCGYSLEPPRRVSTIYVLEQK